MNRVLNLPVRGVPLWRWLSLAGFIGAVLGAVFLLLAGLLVTGWVGTAMCFLIAGGSYLAVLGLRS